MGYNNRNYNNYNNGYNNNGYNGNGYNNPNPQRPYKKRSGCRVKIMEKDGNPVVSAWKKGQSGFLSLYARCYKKSQIREFKDGRKYINLFVTITNKDTLQVTNTSGLFHFDTQKLYIPDLNLIANPRGGRGGYFGVRFTKEYHK